MAEILVSIERLQQLQAGESIVLVDCRFDLAAPQASLDSYLAGHIPGAVYAHLDQHLSSPVTPGSGRHPLPVAEAFSSFLSSIGWQKGKLLVAYDDGSNAFSGRLWWLMRHFGLDAALLDGGLAAWKKAGLPMESGSRETPAAAAPGLQARRDMTISAEDILQRGEQFTLVDARAPERYSGAVEPLDSKAGHIPGAINRPLGRNLGSDGCFKAPAELRQEFEALLEGRDPGSVVHYCGSGVTACHNAFAMELAGMPIPRIYPGSWSEWIRDPSRPTETSA